MDWLQFKFEVSAADYPLVESQLEALGALSLSLEDAADEPFYEPAPGEMPLWQKLTVTALFDGEIDIDRLGSDLSSTLPCELLNWRHKRLQDQAWERVWMKDFHALQFGERLWIVPSWQTPPDPDAINLILDPGLAFGSGTHATTALCLQWLAAHPPLDLEVLDFGCGSGILGIAALMLGARQVTGIDIDPQAIEASAENARRNQVDMTRLQLLQGDSPATSSCDLLVANILSGPLITLATALAQNIRPAGRIILSGILAEQVDNVVKAYQPFFEIVSVEQREDWHLIEGRKKHG